MSAVVHAVIDEFRREYYWLSNYYPAPVTLAGIRYPTTEHAFAAMKSFDRDYRTTVAACATPGEAKRLGRLVRLRDDWNTARFDAMWEITCAKYTQNHFLASQLTATGDALLVEGNTWHDNVWGTCRCRAHQRQWGSNILGIMLMHCRDLHLPKGTT